MSDSGTAAPLGETRRRGPPGALTGTCTLASVSGARVRTKDARPSRKAGAPPASADSGRHVTLPGWLYKMGGGGLCSGTLLRRVSEVCVFQTKARPSTSGREEESHSCDTCFVRGPGTRPRISEVRLGRVQTGPCVRLDRGLAHGCAGTRRESRPFLASGGVVRPRRFSLHLL